MLPLLLLWLAGLPAWSPISSKAAAPAVGAAAAPVPGASRAAAGGARFYPGRYFPGTADPVRAEEVILDPGETSAPLEIPMDAAGGTIRGRVLRGSGTGGIDPDAPSLAGVLVVALSGTLRSVARTGSDGRFVLEGVPAGLVRIRYATDEALTHEIRYLALYHPGVEEVSEAARIPLSDGQDLQLDDVRLPPAVLLGGTVYQGETNVPMAGAQVRIRSRGPVPPRGWSVTASATGQFLEGGLPPGEYTLQAIPPAGGYIGEYFGGARDSLSAQVVRVGAGEARLDLEIRPDSGAVLWGEIRREDGSGVGGIEVRATGGDGAVYTGTTGELGHYRILGLPTGSYVIYVPALHKYYPDTYLQSQARRVRVTEPESVFHIDLRGSPGGCMMPPGNRSGIAGMVRADFTGVQRAFVRAFSATDTLEAEIPDQGRYVVDCLPPGEYRVAFVDEGPLSALYYPGSGRPSDALPVRVVQADTVEQVDFEPARGVELQGRVTDRATGEGLAGVRVLAMESATGAVASARSGQDGVFRLDRLESGLGGRQSGLPAGRWIVMAESTVVQDPNLDPVSRPSINALPVAQGVILIRWRFAGEGVWCYRLWRESSSADSTRLLLAGGDTGSNTGPDWTYLDHTPEGLFVYRLDAALLGATGDCPPWNDPAVESVRTDPVQGAQPPAATALRIRPVPQPWDGRAPLRFRVEGELPFPVRLHIFTPGGIRIATLHWPAGSNECTWDGLTAAGRRVPSGFYLWRLDGARNILTGSLLLIR